jgi:hypothetical protein
MFALVNDNTIVGTTLDNLQIFALFSANVQVVSTYNLIADIIRVFTKFYHCINIVEQRPRRRQHVDMVSLLSGGVSNY